MPYREKRALAGMPPRCARLETLTDMAPPWQPSMRWPDSVRLQKKSPPFNHSVHQVSAPSVLESAHRLFRTTALSCAELTLLMRPVGATGSDSESDDDDEDDDDDDIAMPAGPPPGALSATAAPKGSASDSDASSDDDDDDEIPLPSGPPPPKANLALSSAAAGTSRHSIAIARPTAASLNSLPPPPLPHSLPLRPNFPPRGGMHSYAGGGGPPSRHHHPPPPPFPPPGHFARPAPPGTHMSDPLNLDGGPNRAYQQQQPGRHFGPVQPQPPPLLPPPPAAGPSPFFAVPGAPPSTAIASSSSALAAPTASSLSSSGSATISAAPQLRDLKKEATAFVPLAMRKKLKAQQATLAKAGLTSINAARGSSSAGGGGGSDAIGGEGAVGRQGGGDEVVGPAKKRTLMDEMRERGIGASSAAAAGGSARKSAPATAAEDSGGADDYKRFREEMADLL